MEIPHVTKFCHDSAINNEAIGPKEMDRIPVPFLKKYKYFCALITYNIAESNT